MFHVYVDPLFGDNELATRFNPSNPSSWEPRVQTGNPQPLDPHPDTSSPKPIVGWCQHASYSFRTLTTTPSHSGLGAVDYVLALFASAWDAKTMQLPKVMPSGKIVTHVVIHCLPGLYGPADDYTRSLGLPDVDPLSGLPFNGENFPIYLPHRVSLQGTSAMDTILDCRRVGGNPPIAVFADRLPPPPPSTYWHEESFIDSLTIRGARPTGATQPPPPTWDASGAGIFIHGNSIDRVTISNCVITDNTVGIGLHSSWEPPPAPPPSPGYHAPIIVNNTIAWNRVGLWAGDLHEPPGYANTHAPALLDNIFDWGSPKTAAAPLQGLSCFEGVHPSDLQVRCKGGQTLPDLDFNAWDPAKANLGVVAAPNWPATAPFAGLPTPRVNIQAFCVARDAGAGGILYLNDVFRESPETPGDYSPHDFRLSPYASYTPGPPTLLNPLVNVGMDGSTCNGQCGTLNPGIAMASGTMVRCTGPGLPPGTEDAPLHAWDYDMEGYGNPRSHARTGYPVPPEQYGTIDLGADEMGELIMAGFVPSTRIFTSNDWVAGTHNYMQVFFFNLLNPAGYLRPLAQTWLGQDFQWYPHVLTRPDGYAFPPSPTYPNGYASNYTIGKPATTQWYLTLPPRNRRPFMRGLECDITPHLVMDVHPFWPLYQRTDLGLGLIQGIYPVNPWYENPHDPFNPQADNPALYHSIGVSPVHNTPYQALQTPTAVLIGMPTPPGTYAGTATWLLSAGTIIPFGPFAPCTGINYLIGPWGYNNLPTGCPDILPIPVGLNGFGIRFNCELPPSNLQTFLAVPDVGNLPPAGAMLIGKPPGATPARADMDAAVQKVWSMLGKGQ